VRTNLPAAMQGFVVVPLFAGYDSRRERGRVFSFDLTGGKYEELDFQANGSGGVHARNWIKAQWTEDIDRDACVDLALRALFAAADEMGPVTAAVANAGIVGPAIRVDEMSVPCQRCMARDRARRPIRSRSGRSCRSRCRGSPRASARW